MRKIFLIGLCFYIFSEACFASGTTVFGPVQYTKTSAPVDSYSESFASEQGQGLLIVTNGMVRDPNNPQDPFNTVDYADIEINGIQILSSADFRKTPYSIQKEVELSENNSISIDIDGDAGTYMTVEIIKYPPRYVTFSATPSLIANKGYSTLQWSSGPEGSYAIIEPGVGQVGSAGSRSVTPKKTTTYTITAYYSGGGTATNSVTVTVGEIVPPELTMGAEPQTIVSGQPATLTWESLYADAISIDQGIGPVASSGSMEVFPAASTTYTITATGSGGTTTNSVTVDVIPPPAVSFGTSSSIIETGGTATLSWSTSNADTVEIDQGIGPVPQSGSTDVTPAVSTTYTLTATGPGGTATETVHIYLASPPQASISVNPSTIDPGQTATLTWSAANADSVEIDQGVGAVPLTGSIDVSPASSTSYTITATGPVSIVSDTILVTVNIPAPTLTFSGSPEIIQAGGSSVLTWSASDADSITIDQGIGDVQADGSTTVFPSQTTTYTITASGPGGTSDQSVTIEISPITLSITSPAPSDTIARSDTMVHGTFTNSTGSETGISVNGVTALVYGNQFAANRVPLQGGQNTITVTATDADGNVLTESVQVDALTTADFIRLDANVESGVSPLSTTLTLEGSFDPANPVFSQTPEQGADLQSGSGDNEYDVQITAPGIYLFTAEATSGGQTYSDSFAVLALDGAELNSLITAKWNAIKTELGNGNIDNALANFSYSSREMYGKNFNLMSAHLPEMMNGLSGFTPVKISDDLAQCYVLGEQNGQTFSFSVLFVKDSDGIWRLKNF